MELIKSWMDKSTKNIKLIILVITIAGLFSQPIVLVEPVQNNGILQDNTMLTQKVTTVNAFISTWDTSKTSYYSSPYNAVTLPLVSTGVYNFTADWGDGTNSTITSAYQSQVTHYYTTAGIYNISITGIIDGWSFNERGDLLKITDISQWGPLNFGNASFIFSGASNLLVTATDAPNLTGTTNLAYAFENCASLGSSSNFTNWNVSHVNNMAYMFAEDLSFNSSLSSWDVSHVKNMQEMFLNNAYNSYNSSFNQNISFWNVSSVSNMAGMFSGATSFNQNISSWDVSSVTNMVGMFSEATSFNQNISSWDVSSATNMASMFANAVSFNQSLNSWNVSQVTDMSSMFTGDSLFNQPLNNWNVSSVTNMASMFAKAASFNQPLDSWNVSQVTGMSNMFYLASSFNQPLNSWNVSQVMFMDSMFWAATAFNQSLSSWDVSNVQYMTTMFDNAISFNQPLGSWNVSNVQYMDTMFTGDTLSTQNYNNLLIGWSHLKLRTYVGFSAGNSQYSLLGQGSRHYIITTFQWSITDGGGNQTAPSPPYYLQENYYRSTVHLTWLAPRDNGGEAVANYTIYRSTTSGKNYTFIGQVNASTLSYQDTNITFGTTYYYVIRASNNISMSFDSNEVSTTPYTVPTAPLSLQAKSGNGFVYLSWSAPKSDGYSQIKDYVICRSTNGNYFCSWEMYVSGFSYAFNDTSVTNGYNYTYFVFGYNSAGSGNASNEVNATPSILPHSPLILQVSLGNNFVYLNWSASASANIISYNVYRSTTSGLDYTLLASVATLNYKDTSVRNGQTYYYAVSAVNNYGEGNFSTEVSVTVPIPTSTSSLPISAIGVNNSQMSPSSIASGSSPGFELISLLIGFMVLVIFTHRRFKK